RQRKQILKAPSNNLQTEQELSELENNNLESQEDSLARISDLESELMNVERKSQNETGGEQSTSERKLSEEYSLLENSLSDANAEMDALREKIKALEASESSLKDIISCHVSEKAVLFFLLKEKDFAYDQNEEFEKNHYMEEKNLFWRLQYVGFTAHEQDGAQRSALTEREFTRAISLKELLMKESFNEEKFDHSLILSILILIIILQGLIARIEALQVVSAESAAKLAAQEKQDHYSIMMKKLMY
ncbi:hypothetical protein ACJX0J_023891, partial [Zea mays]